MMKGTSPIAKQELTEIRVLIITPDVSVRAQLEGGLEHRNGFRVSGSVANAEQGIQEIRTHHPDLILVDVDLPGMSGFDLLQKIPPSPRPLAVILSSRADDAVQAFDNFACDFLLKPVQRDRLELTLIRVKDLLGQRGNAQLNEKLNALFRYLNPAKPGPSQTNGKSSLLPVKTSGRIYFIHPQDIEFVEAAGYYIEVFAKNKKHLIRQSLTHLEGYLDSRQFIRIHRSVIINVQFLKEIVRDGANDFSVRMTSDATFKISRSYKAEVFGKIGL